MNNRFKRVLLLFVLAVALSGAGWFALPHAIAALPSQYRQRLPHELLRLVTTPLPTALPAPSLSVVTTRIIVPTIVVPDPATSEPSPTTTAPNEIAAAASPLPLATTAAAEVDIMATTTPSPSATPTPRPTVEPLPLSASIDGLEIIPQKFNNCGPTNLSIALGYYGHQVHQLEIAAQLRPNPDDRNVSPEELVEYVVSQTDLRATLHRGGDLLLLKRLIAAGFPVIIEKGLKPSEWEGWMGHYLTVYGYDDVARELYSMDTFLGPWDGSGRADSYITLLREWEHFNYAFYVIYPARQEATIQEILGPDYMDPIAMWQQAALKAQSRTQAEPDNAFVWFNLGASLTRLGQLTGQADFFWNAAAAFDRAREIGLPARMLWYQFEPYIAYLETGRTEDVLVLADATLRYEGGIGVEETFLYRGHALMAQGNQAGAEAAYRTALRLNSGFRLAQEALDTG